MLKTVLMLFVTLVMSFAAIAATDVNTADQTALEAIKGLGPVKSKAIIDERSKNGPFKDASDLATRVKGLGTKSVSKLEAAGLTINGQVSPGSASTPSRTLTNNKAAPLVIPPSITAPSQPTPASRASGRKTERGATATNASPDLTASAAASSTKTKKNSRKQKQNKNEAEIPAPGA